MNAGEHRHAAQRAARLLLELCQIAEHVRHNGSCVGELRATDLIIRGNRIERRPANMMRRFRYRFAVRKHLRHGHDQFCVVLGVPYSALRELSEHWGGTEASSFLIDIVSISVQQFVGGGWHGMTAREVLKHEIGRRLTVEAPADLLLDQIPSTPAKFASSRRTFTWPRKRAASAPSTMR